MTEPHRSDYAFLRGQLAEMQASPAYSMHKGVLVRAEQIIGKLEQELSALRAQIDKESK
jgi:hypothetical protein